MGCGIFGPIILILIGIWIWASNYGYIKFFRFSRDWPIILILIGIYGIYFIITKRKRWFWR